MSSAKFTLIGCEKYFSHINQSLFDNLEVPSGITKSTLTDNILMRGGEFEVQYGNPEFIRSAIGIWSNKWMPTMTRWVNALAIEYNPLENYDRMEDWTDNTARSDASSELSSTGRNLDRTENRTHDESEASNSEESSSASEDTETSESATYSQSDAKSATSDTDGATTFDRDKYNNPPTHTTKKSAYDQSTYSPYSEETDSGKWEEKTDSSMTSSESGASSSESSGSSETGVTSSNSRIGSDSRAGSSSDSANIDENEDVSTSHDASSAMNNDSVHSGRIHGNIGVTTSQQMLQQELDLGYWNIYEKITELFLQEFTIPVYE